MAVFRIEKTRDYTVMANHHLRNTALSLKAKGLLSLMLSLPEDWDYTTKGLARICRDGVDSICATVRELEDAGYIIRERVRNANGRLGSIEYTILEQPRPPEPKPGKPERENPVQVKPVLDSPVLGKPEQEKPAQLNTKGSSNQISNTDSSSTEGSNPIQSSPQTPAETKRTGRDWMRERESYRELILENIEYDYLPSKPIGVGIMPEKSQRQRQLFLSVKLLFQFPNLNYPERDTLTPYTNPVTSGMNIMVSASHIQEPSLQPFLTTLSLIAVHFMRV